MRAVTYARRAGEAVAMMELDGSRRRRELLVFLFLTVVLAPVLAVAIVGGYGFAVWMYQLVSGPPTG
jgi:nitrate reductase NapE